MRRKIYSIFEDERELIYEDVLNDQNQILSFIDHQSEGENEVINLYNSKGLLISETEYVLGDEAAKTEFQYDEFDNVIKKEVYVADDLFEKVDFEYFKEGQTRVKVRMGVDIERFIERLDGETFVREYYDEHGLVERQIVNYTQSNRNESIEILDDNGEKIGSESFWYDEAKRVLKFEERNANGNLMDASKHEYDGDLIVFEKFDNYYTDEHYELTYEYNAQGYYLGMEKKSQTGNLLGFHKQILDEQNRVISEHGYDIGSFNAIYGNYVDGNKYMFEHEYQEADANPQ